MNTPNKKINLMHVVLSLEVGGLEKLVVESALGIDKDLYNVEVCCFDTLGSFSATLLSHGIKVTLLQRNQHRYDYFFPLKLRSFLIKKKVHILHIHSGTFFLSVQAGFLARTPVMVYTDHGRQLVETKIEILMDRFSGIFADKIIAVSKELENYLVDMIKLPAKKTTTIINGINTEKYSVRMKPADLMKEFGIAQKFMVIGTVGRLAEVKDQTSLIEAFSIVHKEIPNSILMLVGDGPMRKELSNKITELKLNDYIKITGNRNDVPQILNLFDIFVLSSLSEGTSVALLEAMSSGIAPIVTDVGGNPSIVDNNVNGNIVKPKEVFIMADTMIELLKDDKKRRNYGTRASIKINTHYSIRSMLNQYTELYMAILKYKNVTISG